MADEQMQDVTDALYDTDLEDADEEEDGETVKRKQAEEDASMPYPEGENYAKLCLLFYHGAPLVMSYIFDMIHPPATLVERLAMANIHKTLRRFKVLGMITPENWNILYPQDKRRLSSKKFGAVLTHLLLQNVCHMSAPYPNGWDELPEDQDRSLAAETVRLNYYLSTLVHLKREISDKEYELHHKYMSGILEKIAPTTVTSKLDRINKTRLPDKKSQDLYIDALKSWYAEAVEIRAKEKKVQEIVELRDSSDHDLSRLNKNKLDAGSSDTYSEFSLRTKASVTSSASSTTTSVASTTATWASKKVSIKSLEKQIITKFQKRLTESILAEDVIGKLVQKGLLTHEEKNKIQIQSSNPNRMKMLLDIIMKKPGKTSPFDAFCDAIKFKYKGVYSILLEARNAPFLMNKPDEASECAAALRAHYNDMVSNMSPFPWNSSQTLPLSQYYQDLYLTDLHGKDLEPTQIFNPSNKMQRPKRVLIQGDGGVGKSTMAKRFLSEWADGRNEALNEKIKLAFYVDLKTALNGDLCATLVDQCLPASYKKSPDELYNIIKGSQKRALFILDGYEHIKGIDDEFLDLLHKSIFKDCYIVVLTRSQYVSDKLVKLFDTRLAILGLKTDAIRNFIYNYIEFTETSKELYDFLIVKLNDPEPSAMKMFAANPLQCLCLCLITQYEGNLDFATLTFMLEEFITALAKHFCHEFDMKMNTDGGLPDSIFELIAIFEEVAFENLLENKIVLDMASIIRKHQRIEVRHFGLFNTYITTDRGVSTENCQFTNLLFQEILAARFLLRIELEDFPRYIEHLTTEKHLYNMTILFVGLQKDDKDSTTVPEIFKSLKQNNLQVWNRMAITADDLINEINANKVNRKKSSNEAEGRLTDFEFSLKCLNEFEGRRDMAKYIVESLPKKIYMKNKDIFSGAVVAGLGYVLQQNYPVITELELRLNHFGHYFAHSMTKLAQGIECSVHISLLRLRWTNDSLLALFLSNIFGGNESISVLKIYDESKLSRDNISATVWSNFWSARKGMEFVEALSFTSCHNPALVSSVVRNIPANLEELSLNNCTLDMVAAQELSRKIEKVKSLKLVSLQGAQFKKPDFLQISTSIRHTQSLSELILADTHLDQASTLALAESIKFNKTLRRLDLAGAAFNSEGCRTMGLALALNKTLLEVHMQGALITKEGIEDIKKIKREGVNLTGLEK